MFASSRATSQRSYISSTLRDPSSLETRPRALCSSQKVRGVGGWGADGRGGGCYLRDILLQASSDRPDWEPVLSGEQISDNLLLAGTRENAPFSLHCKKCYVESIFFVAFTVLKAYDSTKIL